MHFCLYLQSILLEHFQRDVSPIGTCSCKEEVLSLWDVKKREYINQKHKSTYNNYIAAERNSPGSAALPTRTTTLSKWQSGETTLYLFLVESNNYTFIKDHRNKLINTTLLVVVEFQDTDELNISFSDVRKAAISPRISLIENSFNNNF